MKQVAVIGSGVAGAALIEAAEALGRGIAERGWTLITGGRGGVMEAASRGAASVGGSVVAVGGEAGTLSEIGLAMKLGRSVLGLDLGEGWSARLPGLERARDVPGVLAWLESRGAPASSS